MSESLTSEAARYRRKLREVEAERDRLAAQVEQLHAPLVDHTAFQRALSLAPGESLVFQRRQAFREVTTRRHYPGGQAVSVRINGQDTPPVAFLLEPAPSATGSAPAASG